MHRFHQARLVSFVIVLTAVSWATASNLAARPLCGDADRPCLVYAAATAGERPLKVPAGVTVGPSIAGISEYTLSNGLKVLLLPDPSQDTITVNVTYLVGSRHEDYGERGMAHLLEHMLFKGSPRHANPKGELLKRGARYNGTTSYDRTNYFETFPASQETLEFVLDLEADRMVNARVSKKDLDSEMTVVRNEFEAGENSPFSLLRERTSAAAYMWHNYGRAIIGTRSDIENVPIERLQAFYRHYYQPDNAVLVIAGRFDPQRALGTVSQTFGRIPKPERVLRTTYTAEPPQDGERLVILRRVGDVQLATAMYHVPPGAHPEYVAVDLLTQVLVTQPSGRLHKALVETGIAATSFGAERQMRESGSVYFGVSVNKDASLERARDVLLTTLEGFATKPVTDEEVERARTKLKNDIEQLLANSRSLALALSEFVAIGDWRLLFLYREQLGKATRADVQRAAVAYLKPANRTLGLFYPTPQPERVAMPPPPSVATLLKDLRSPSDIAIGEAFDPTPENIEARVVRKTLPSGMKLALLPKKTRGGTVFAQLGLRWGNEVTTANRNAACSVANTMLSRGTLKRTRGELRDALDRLQATVNVSTEGATIQTIRANLPETLRLAAEMLREPSFPQAEFEQVKRQLLSSLDTQRTDPQALASLSMGRHLHPYPTDHWLYTPTLDERAERIKAVTLEDARRCYRELVGATNSEFAIVGDFDPVEIGLLVESLFADWKTPGPYKRISQRYFDVQRMDRLIETPDKANAVFRAGLNLKLRDDHPDYAALVLGNYLIGGSSDARLARRVRERDGLSYSVGSWLAVNPQDEASEFGIYAIHAPQNRARVEAAVLEEIRRALDDGFSAQEFEDGRKGLLKARQVARNADSALCARLVSYAVIDRTFAWDAALEKRIESLTPREVLDALRRHLRIDNLSLVKAGDFTRVAAEAQSVAN
jgi:zinc protease